MLSIFRLRNSRVELSFPGPPIIRNPKNFMKNLFRISSFRLCLPHNICESAFCVWFCVDNKFSFYYSISPKRGWVLKVKRKSFTRFTISSWRWDSVKSAYYKYSFVGNTMLCPLLTTARSCVCINWAHATPNSALCMFSFLLIFFSCIVPWTLFDVKGQPIPQWDTRPANAALHSVLVGDFYLLAVVYAVPRNWDWNWTYIYFIVAIGFVVAVRTFRILLRWITWNIRINEGQRLPTPIPIPIPIPIAIRIPSKVSYVLMIVDLTWCTDHGPQCDLSGSSNITTGYKSIENCETFRNGQRARAAWIGAKF